MLKTEWLIYFHTLVEHGSFKQAAATLAISTQNLRHNIRQLEQALGLQLIARTRQNALTAAGQSFYQHAQDLLQDLLALKQDFQHQPRQKILGCTLRYTPYLQLLPGWEPGRSVLDFDLVTGFQTDSQLLEALLSQQIDAAITREAVLHSDLSCQKMQDQGLILEASPRTRPVPWSELQYISYHHQEQFQDIFWPTRHPRQTIARCSSLELAKTLCMQGFGALYLPASLAQPESGLGLLHRTSEAPFSLPPMYFVTR